jgi:hypothetical protein
MGVSGSIIQMRICSPGTYALYTKYDALGFTQSLYTMVGVLRPGTSIPICLRRHVRFTMCEKLTPTFGAGHRNRLTTGAWAY